MTNSEKKMIQASIKNITLWKDESYTSGGANNVVNSTKAIEDLKMTYLVATAAGLKPKLSKIIKSLQSLASSQDMFVDTNALNKIKLLLTNIKG